MATKQCCRNEGKLILRAFFARLPDVSTVSLRCYLLGGDTASPNGLLARLFPAFLIIYFLMTYRRQIISGSDEPIFTIFSPDDSVLGADEPSGALFLISQGTLLWQTIL